VTYAVAVQVTFSSLYTPAEWPNLAGLFATLLTAPDPSAAGARRTATVAAGKLPASFLESNRREEDYESMGSYLQPCVESRKTGRPLAYPAYADEADARAPHFGRFRVWIGQTCEFIPRRDKDAYVGPWKLKVKSPVLVFGTRYDPATPYEMTRPYADLYPDARMVTVNGWGHTTIGKSACADAAITKYLVNLQAPADGSTCEQDRRPFDPPLAPGS
jgi:pimeloyl-ACP methyl ester carboxylesterase